MSIIKTYKKDGSLLYELDENKEIARGGEGFLIPIPGNKKIVAKIYLPGCVNLNETKFTYLNKLDGNLFIRPLHLLYDKSHAIIGIIMDYLPKEFYPLDAIFNKNFCLQNKIDINIKSKIAKQLITAVNSAHNLKINIGDLSALNVMINNQGDVKFIDVDSYEVPGIKHTDKLLEDIRDYLYGGHVCENSDFFSLSVIIFNYLTYLHPFKGVHTKIPKMVDRMIKKAPVFQSDPNLITPKCYEPVGDHYLQEQFEKLYLKGERFLLSIDRLAQPILGKKVTPQIIDEAEVTLQNMLTKTEIEYAFFNDKHGMIRTKDHYFIFDTSTRKSTYQKGKLERSEWDDVFIGKENIIITKNDQLFLYTKGTGNVEEIVNIKINHKARFSQFENFLVMLEEDYLTIIDLDVVKFKNIKFTKTSVYGPGFMNYNGLIQNVGGVHYIHYTTGKNMSIAKSPINMRGVIQRKDIGITQFQDGNIIKFKYYNITNGKINLFNETDMLSSFAYKGINSQDAMIFIPKDNNIEVLRGMDFYKLADIKCSMISDHSRLFNTQSGLIVVNEDEAWLLNKQ